MEKRGSWAVLRSRRLLLVAGLSLAAASALALSLHGPVLLLACAFSACSISGWNALNCLSAESFPLEARAASPPATASRPPTASRPSGLARRCAPRPSRCSPPSAASRPYSRKSWTAASPSASRPYWRRRRPASPSPRSAAHSLPRRKAAGSAWKSSARSPSPREGVVRFFHVLHAAWRVRESTPPECVTRVQGSS